MPWQRPATVPIGQVWSRFEGRERDGKPAQMYQIRDMDETIRKECLDMMQEIFLTDEPTCDAFDIINDPVSIKKIREDWERFVSQNVSLACYTDVDGERGELVGFNVILVKSLDDEEENTVLGKPWEKFLQILGNVCDVFKHYNVDKYLSSNGLTVLPKFRGQNIGARLLAAREPLCKALGIKATATAFTAPTLQASAAKCNYEVLAELKYSDMLQYGIDMTCCPTPSAIVMGIKFNF